MRTSSTLKNQRNSGLLKTLILLRLRLWDDIAPQSPRVTNSVRVLDHRLGLRVRRNIDVNGLPDIAGENGKLHSVLRDSKSHAPCCNYGETQTRPRAMFKEGVTATASQRP